MKKRETFFLLGILAWLIWPRIHTGSEVVIGAPEEYSPEEPCPDGFHWELDKREGGFSQWVCVPDR